MLATQTPVSAAPSRLLGIPIAELKFRIQGGEHHGRILRIAAAKCSIGSAPGCTLRLRRDDIEPLHCLILCGRNGAIIRRNSSRTYLNGGPFEDATLHAGDLLRVGSIELEVVACPQAVNSLRPQPVQKPAQADYNKQEQQRQSAELAAMGEQLLAAREQLEQARRGSAEACEEHTREVNQLREELRQGQEKSLSQQQEVRAEGVAQLEQLRSEQTALGAERQQLEGKLAALENELSQQQQRLDEQHREREELTAARGRLEDSVSTLSEQLRCREAKLTAAQQRWSDGDSTSTAALESARSELSDLQVRRRQDEEERTTMRTRLEEQLADLTARLDEREAVRGRLEDSVSTLTEQLRCRDAELTAAQQRGTEGDGTLTAALASARCELRDLQAQLHQEEDERATSRARQEEQLADLTLRLVERERELAHSDGELTELRQRAAHFSASDQVIKQLEECLANSALAQRAEREAWQQERLALESQRRELQTARRELESQAPLAQEAAENAAIELAAQQYEEQVERWQSEAQKWQLQAQEFAGQLGEGKLLCAKLETELTELKGAVPASDAEGAQQQNVEDLRTQLDRQQQELAQARADLQEERSQLGRLRIEASSREEVVARFEAELQEREAAWDAARGDQAGKLAGQSQLLASQVAQFEAEQAAFARQQAAIIKQMSSLEDRVQELTSASESRTTNSPFVIPRLDPPSRKESLPAAAAPDRELSRPEVPQLPEPPPAEFVAEVAPPEPSPAEVNSVLNRLPQAGPWKGEESESPETDETPVETPAPENPKFTPPSFLEQAAEMASQEELAGMADRPAGDVPLPASDSAEQLDESFSPTEGEGDDSIEQYMSRLLHRMRGGAAPPAFAPATREDQPKFGAPAVGISPAAVGEHAPTPKEYVPRAPVAEQPERLSLMRELANSAAQSAIHTHARQHQRRETRRKSLVALLSLIGGTSLAIVACVNGSLIAIAGATIFIAICCVMSMRAITGGFRQLRLAPPAEIGDAPEAAASSQQSEQA